MRRETGMRHRLDAPASLLDARSRRARLSGQAGSTRLESVGVEEEFHLVGLRDRRLVARSGDVLRHLPRDRFAAELHGCVVESNSHPVTLLAELGPELVELRRDLVRAAEPLGLGVAAAGAVPLADLDSLEITPNPRYGRMADDYQALAREQLICGAQVHVDVEDRDLAVAVIPRVSPWLPVLLALSASSPFWLGADTGYASFRTMVWQRWPTAGAFGSYRSAEEYDQVVADLVATGVISDPGMLYFDARPSAHLSTVELRVPDACPRVEDVVLLAGLFRALVIQAGDAVAAGEPPVPARPELQRAATWRAARSGLEGELLDPVSMTPEPAGRVVARLVGELRPALEAAGDWPLVTRLAEEALRRGSSAARQRAALARRGALTDAVDLTLSETRAGMPGFPLSETG